MTLLPPPGIARTLCVQSVVYAVGNGVFATGSAVFFLHVAGLTPVQVGIAFSVAGALSLLLSVPLGSLADRFGGRRTWLAGVLLEAALLLGYPWLRGFTAFLLLLPLIGLAESLSGSGRAVYSAQVLPRETRVRTLAFVRTALNIGFFAGGALAAVPLAIGTPAAFRLMILANALGMLVNAVMVARMPDPPPSARSTATPPQRPRPAPQHAAATPSTAAPAPAQAPATTAALPPTTAPAATTAAAVTTASAVAHERAPASTAASTAATRQRAALSTAATAAPVSTAAATAEAPERTTAPQRTEGEESSTPDLAAPASRAAQVSDATPTSGAASDAAPVSDAAPAVRRGAVWRDRPFLALAALSAVLAGHASLTTEVVPLWLAARTDAPKVTLAVLFGFNTAMCVALQVLASRGADTPRGIARVLRRGGFAVAVACLPVYLSGHSTGWLTIALLLFASALITLSELWHSAGYWGITTELPPPEVRGEYVGAARMSFGVQSMVGPASLTFLAMHGGGLGWLAIAAVFVLGALLVGPVMTWITGTPRVALTTAAG